MSAIVRSTMRAERPQTDNLLLYYQVSSRPCPGAIHAFATTHKLHRWLLFICKVIRDQYLMAMKILEACLTVKGFTS